jgi:hypothetical protein
VGVTYGTDDVDVTSTVVKGLKNTISALTWVRIHLYACTFLKFRTCPHHCNKGKGKEKTLKVLERKRRLKSGDLFLTLIVDAKKKVLASSFKKLL